METDPALKERRVNLVSIAAGFDLHREVRNYLISEVMFHNVAKVGKMYKSVLDIDFPPDLEEIFSAVSKRHDIVHRSGRSTDGAQANVEMQDVVSLIKCMKAFIKTIEDQL